MHVRVQTGNRASERGHTYIYVCVYSDMYTCACMCDCTDVYIHYVYIHYVYIHYVYIHYVYIHGVRLNPSGNMQSNTE